MKIIYVSMVALFAVAISLAQVSSPEVEVRKAISSFEAALQQKDLKKIEPLVSSDIVVFENGYRNDGWQDFRDHHLIPEFKESSSQYSTTIRRVEASPSLAWGYSSMKRVVVQKKDAQPDVWTSYVLQKENGTWKIVMLSWSVRRTSE